MEAKKPKKDELPATLGFEPALAELETLVKGPDGQATTKPFNPVE